MAAGATLGQHLRARDAGRPRLAKAEKIRKLAAYQSDSVRPRKRTKYEESRCSNLEKLLKEERHMPEDKFLVMSRKGKRLGVAYASTPRGEGTAGSLKFKAK